MMVFLLMAASGAIAPADASERVVIDLTAPEPCASTDEAVLANQIVVCGERERQRYYRVVASDRPEGTPLPKAEVQLAEGTTLAAETESADLGMARSQRAMVRLKIKF